LPKVVLALGIHFQRKYFKDAKEINMSETHPFEEMLKKIAEAVRAELGPTYQNIIESPDLALALSAKVALAVANIAAGKILDRSSQRAIKDFQEACLQRVFMSGVAETFQNKALLAKIQTAMLQAAAQQLKEKAQAKD
jgi:hypothetical protein